MKILLVTSPIVDLRQPFAGGTEAFVVRLANGLAERGHTVDVLCQASDETNLFTSLHINESALRMCDAITSEKTGQKQYQAAQFGLLDSDEYDVIHYHSYYHAIYDYGFMHQRQAVITLHSPVTPRLALLHQLHRARSDDIYVAVSQRLASRWQHQIGGDIQVISNGIERSQHTDITVEENYYLWSGRICSAKNPVLAIQWAKQHELQLKLVGPIADEGYFTSYIEPLLDENVTYAGHVDQSEHKEFLRHARALFMTSDWEEPFGLVTLEALNEGTPVIGVSNAIVEELRMSPMVQIVDDRLTIARCLTKLKHISANQCRQVAEKFDFANTLKQYEELYASLQ